MAISFRMIVEVPDQKRKGKGKILAQARQTTTTASYLQLKLRVSGRHNSENNTTCLKTAQNDRNWNTLNQVTFTTDNLG